MAHLLTTKEIKQKVKDALTELKILPSTQGRVVIEVTAEGAVGKIEVTTSIR